MAKMFHGVQTVDGQRNPRRDDFGRETRREKKNFQHKSKAKRNWLISEQTNRQTDMC